VAVDLIILSPAFRTGRRDQRNKLENGAAFLYSCNDAIEATHKEVAKAEKSTGRM
jgi:hypothetical protein